MRTLTLAAIVVAHAGCYRPNDEDVVQWSDEFEACDDLCGWDIVGGAARVTTYHAGEHALRLDAGALAMHDLTIERGATEQWDNFTDGNWLEVTSDCIGPGALELRSVGADRWVIEIGLDDRGVGEYLRHRINFPPLPLDNDLSVVGIELRTGARACVVDNLQVRISGGASGY